MKEYSNTSNSLSHRTYNPPHCMNSSLIPKECVGVLTVFSVVVTVEADGGGGCGGRKQRRKKVCEVALMKLSSVTETEKMPAAVVVGGVKVRGMGYEQEVVELGF